jgi:hypothetical protein
MNSKPPLAIRRSLADNPQTRREPLTRSATIAPALQQCCTTPFLCIEYQCDAGRLADTESVDWGTVVDASQRQRTRVAQHRAAICRNA